MGGLSIGDLINTVLVLFVLPLVLKWQDARASKGDGDMRKSEKRTGDETEISKILLEQRHETDTEFKRLLAEQTIESKTTLANLQVRFDNLSEEVLLLERKNARLEGQLEKYGIIPQALELPPPSEYPDEQAH